MLIEQYSLQDSVTGLLLAGVGVCIFLARRRCNSASAGILGQQLLKHSFLQHVTQPPDSQKNFLVVDAKTEDSTIEGAFDRFTNERKDIAIILINQHVGRTKFPLPHRFCSASLVSKLTRPLLALSRSQKGFETEWTPTQLPSPPCSKYHQKITLMTRRKTVS